MDERRHRIDWGEAVVPGLGLAFGLAFFFQTRNAPAAAMYWPIIAASLTGVLWLFIFFRFVLVKKDQAPSSAEAKGLAARLGEARRPGLILVSTAAYLVTLPYLGFSVSSSLFMLAVFRGLGSRKWIKNIVVAVGLTAFLHLMLIVLMHMSLPRLNIGGLTI